MTICHFLKYCRNQTKTLFEKMDFYASSLNIHENIRDYFE